MCDNNKCRAFVVMPLQQKVPLIHQVISLDLEWIHWSNEWGTSELHPHFVVVCMCATTHANFYLVMHSVLKNDSKKSTLSLTPTKHHAQHLSRWHKEVNLQLHNHSHSLPRHHNNCLPFPLVFQSTSYLLHSFLASIMVWIGDAKG